MEAFRDVIQSFPDDSFDLVVVDCHRGSTRIECAAAAKEKVKPGAILLFDDTEDPNHAQAFSILRDWSVRRFVGVKSRPLMAVETAIFTRPTRMPSP